MPEGERLPESAIRFIVKLQSMYRGTLVRTRHGHIYGYDPYDRITEYQSRLQRLLAQRAEEEAAGGGGAVSGTLPSDVEGEAVEPGSPHLIQVGGHGTIAKCKEKPGAIVKEVPQCEKVVYESVQGTPIEQLLPAYHGCETHGSYYMIRLQNLTAGMKRPCVMDIKMGRRTFLESETSNSKLRVDLAKKMVEIDPDALTSDELSNGVTKLRYMQFREQRSSSAAYGFRIEGAHTRGVDYPDCKDLRSKEQIDKALRFYLQSRAGLKQAFVARLNEVKAALQNSEWFMAHEVVGSSILFVYDDLEERAACEASASAHLIDFAKTERLPDGRRLTHTEEWTVGNREDGYLVGLTNLINVFDGLEGMDA
ncbi:hypothetical protein AB1Y20_012028 [Prymnesium parvum]|uniref:Kinase n=1 Tax=Prymnesium parvum TaxID=97485 RepID=A0AB34IQ23_PRYPA